MESTMHQIVEAPGAILRPTDERDLPTLRALFDNPGFNEQWGGQPLTDREILAKYTGLRAPAVACFIVEEDESPIGFMQYHVADDGGEGGGIDLVLSPEVRGRGLGTAVVRAMIEYLRGSLGWRRITVDPDVSNPRGVNFWLKVGFRGQQLIESDADRQPYWLMEWPATGPTIER